MVFPFLLIFIFKKITNTVVPSEMPSRRGGLSPVYHGTAILLSLIFSNIEDKTITKSTLKTHKHIRYRQATGEQQVKYKETTDFTQRMNRRKQGISNDFAFVKLEDIVLPFPLPCCVAACFVPYNIWFSRFI
jgi:hypothetical protein